MNPKNPLGNLTPTEADLDSSSSPISGDEKLREKAAKIIHGPNANPSQLGDPISLKAETSDSSTDLSNGSNNNTPSSASSSSPPSSSSPGKDQKGGKETLREKATKKLHGSDANPSQLGDPVSLKAETIEHDGPAPGEGEGRAAHGRNSGAKSRL